MGHLAQWPLSNSTRFIFETRMGLLANIWPQPQGPHTSVNCGAYKRSIKGTQFRQALINHPYEISKKHLQ